MLKEFCYANGIILMEFCYADGILLPQIKGILLYYQNFASLMEFHYVNRNSLVMALCYITLMVLCYINIIPFYY